MKCFVVLSTLVISTMARPQSQSVSSQYGAPRPQQVGQPDISKSIAQFSRSFVSSGTGYSSNAGSGSNFGSTSGSTFGSTSGSGSNFVSGSGSNSAGSSTSFGTGSGFGSSGSSSGIGSRMSGPKVYKHISVHVSPEEKEERPMKRVIRPMEKPDQVVNIIFIKAPSSSSSRMTEVILPQQAETKTVIYVLLKKASTANNDIKIREPMPTRPPKPEVFFINYGKGQGQDKGKQNTHMVGNSVGNSIAASGTSTQNQGGYQ